jgi:tetratricopeptide (TPR) repeat protein
VAGHRSSPPRVRRFRTVVLLAVAPAALAACATLGVRSAETTAAERDSAESRARSSVARLLRSYDLSAVPPRPRLDGAAPDTNDAMLYFAHGMSVFKRDPTEAAESFAWATRLDPSFGQAYYNRWLALQQRRDSQLRDEAVRSGPGREAESLRIDSLVATAQALNPFVATAEGDLETLPGATLDAAAYGRRDFARGKYAAAIREWGHALERTPEAVDVRIWRARAMFFLARYADAAQELTVALEVVERAERDSARFVGRVRKEMLSYAIGLLQAQRGDLVGAREAYEQAIAENLGFYMAHARLAGLALLQHDTTTALVEYETAAGIRGDDAALRFLYGYALFQAGHVDDAERQLREAVRLAPDYAAPYAWLGRVLEARGDAARAHAAYADYLARASRSAPDVAWVRRRTAGDAAVPADARTATTTAPR